MCLKKMNKEETEKENNVIEENEELERLFEKYEDEIYNNSQTKKSDELLKEQLRLEDKFIKSLSKEKQKEYNEIDRIRLEHNTEIEKSIFIYGYKLAVRLMLESIKK